MTAWHWLLGILGIQNSASKAYNLWSGFAGDVTGFGIFVAIYKRFTCHTWWCPRHGHYDFTDARTGVTFKLCRHCHPDHPGRRLTRRHIARIHARNREHSGRPDGPVD